MEGEPEESEEDAQEEDKPTVLWEKCIQQSIIVDLSEDESLHFSDLEGSLNLHLSLEGSAASEASIHLSESAELSSLGDTSSECSVVSSQSERVVENKSKNSLSHLSCPRPNTIQEELPLSVGCEDQGENTSDEDQEDLPFDDELGSLYFNQTVISEGNLSSDGGEAVYSSPDVPSLPKLTTTDKYNFTEGLDSAECDAEKQQVDGNTKQDCSCDASKPRAVSPLCPGPVDINQLLLRHFSKEELLQSGRLIEAETLPEVSLLESMDDTVFSLAQTHNIPANNGDNSESHTCNSEISHSLCSRMTEEKRNNASKHSGSDEDEQSKTDHVAPAATESIAYMSARTDSNENSEDNSAADTTKQQISECVGQVSVAFVRTRSFSEIKYGQGQVHYPLPDFSKVAPKVRIPKAPTGPAKPVPQSPCIMHRAQSSPGMLDVISRVLEDSLPPSVKPYVFKHEEKQPSPAMVHHLQAEYDKLLTKYAEAENLIDQMRLGTSTQTSSEIMLQPNVECHPDQLNDDGDDNENVVEGSHIGSMASQLPPSDSLIEEGTTEHQSNNKGVTQALLSQTEEGPSDGESMTAELSDIISQFIQKVQEFKFSVGNMSMSTAEQQMMLRSMMEAQDQLERKYISKKNEHRALEMQNYMGLSRNTGTFDPNRLVEGEIFRIGMHLEDIKEMIDKNVCEQISSPQSSSTPTHMKEMLHLEPSPPSIKSPPPSLHDSQGPSACFSVDSCEMQMLKEEKQEEKAKNTSLVYGDHGLEQSRQLISTESNLKRTGFNSCSSWLYPLPHLRSPQGSLEDLNVRTAEDEEGSKEERETDHSKILAHLSGSNSYLTQRERKTESCRSLLESAFNPDGEQVSPAVEASRSSDTTRGSHTLSLLEPNLSALSRIVSPETDSGFGSSYLNQSGSGSFQTNYLTESVHTHNEALGSSDSEDSRSNLQTAIHSVSLTSQQCLSPHTSVQALSSSAAVGCWVENNSEEPSERLQYDKTGSDSIQPAKIDYRLSTSVVSATMDTEKRSNESYRCSCNSEAILALQSEVSRLKRDLEDGLVQLPHLAQKMNYLTSKYKQDRLERRSKPRTRMHEKSASANSPTKIEDWISSDMDPSKSKGTDSGDTATYSPVGSRRGSSIQSGTEFRSKPRLTLQSHRGKERSMKTFGSTSLSLRMGKDSERTKTTMDSIHSRERWAPLSSPSLQKPLLQVNYGSSSSLPASYKVRGSTLESTSYHRKRSTQSDTALLPSNVYFQQTLSPVSLPSTTGSRTGRRRGSKEEDMNRSLDHAIEVACSIKRMTDRMAKQLSADLAKAQLYRKLHNIQPLGGRKHQEH